MKLIVINSHGPMGSTTLSAILEHFGYLSLPIRKVALTEYLSGNYNLQNKFFQNRIVQIAHKFSSKRISRSRSMIDNNENILLDKKVVEEAKKFRDREFDSFSKMYFEAYNLFYRHMIYKEKKDYEGVIELSTNSFLYKPDEYYDLFKKNFSEVIFFNLDRNFENWLNSLMSQFFVRDKISIKNMIKKLSSIIRDYNKYKKFLRTENKSINIKFEEMFRPFDENFLKKMETKFNNNKGVNYWKSNKYDHYGYLLNYDDTFEIFDDKIKFISSFSKKIALKSYNENNKNIFRTFIYDLSFQISFIFDIIRFKYFKWKKN